ncbi:hypothetical protein MKW98_006267 [Papaver atlanticum]|uniref:F-box associated domain-containing protein n=1 Tax=Papaver atlanticum TaxID=357466 RepID=A0AAD4TGK8_9MAGN|nr:hypothetical protein MKW98_006267 [Papaver atlanticum]
MLSSSNQLKLTLLNFSLIISNCYEILTRASSSTLLRQSRGVRKDWHKLVICDSKFQQTHSQRTTACGLFSQVISTTRPTFVSFVRSNNDHEEDYNCAQQVQSPSLDFLPTAESITIAGSSLHGALLCCFTNSSSTPIPSFYTCKPASHERRKMPNPNTSFEYSMIGIAILRLSHLNRFDYHCQLFNSETWAWKKLPLVQFKRESYKVAVCCDGKLGVIYHTNEWMKLWILENYSTTKPSWKRKYSNDTRSLHQNVENLYAHHMWSNNTVMMMGKFELVAFNCDKNTYTRTKLPMTAEI